jgi:uroporphyrin-III C-methyltransferase
MPVGFVSLIGAGPGCPDLITVRGLRALQAAQVILYDALLDPSFRELFPAQALALPVGKRCGKASLGQADIHRLIIDHALAGRRVVRLKGGDPLVFGRGGEEAQALEAAGIPYEVVPGVSALLAGAAGAGFPLTHREVSRRITVLEGHHLPESPAAWRDLVASGGTLAVYMGTRTLQTMAQSLLDHGAAPGLPVALVEQAQCPGQVSTFSTLAHAAAGALRPATVGPGILFIGKALLHRFHPTSEIPHEPIAAVPGSAREARPRGGRRERRAS